MQVDTMAGGRPSRELRRARLATATLFFANGCGLGSWLPHIPDVKIWHGLSEGVLGLALLAIAGGAVASLPLAGALTARYGSRPISRAAALLFCAVLPLPLLAPDFALLLAAFVLLGIGIGALDVSMNAHAVLVEEGYGRPIMSSFHGLFSLGGLFGAALAGGAMTVGLPPAPHLVTSAAVLGLAALAAWPALLPTVPAPAGGPLFVLPRGRLAVLGAIALVAFMAEGAMGDWSAIYIRMDLGATPATAAWGFAAFSLTMAIGRLSGDGLVAHFTPAGMVVAGALIGAITLGAALLAGHPVAAVLGFAGMGIGLANIAPIVFSAAGRLPDLAPGIGIAAVSTAGYCGFLAGPPLIGLMAEASGLPIALGLVAGTVGLMVMGAAALQRRPAAAVALAGVMSMATQDHSIDSAAQARLRTGRLGLRLAAAGECLSLYATVLVLVMIGGLKFTAYEAEAIRPLVATSPLLSWAYGLFSLQAFSNLLGVVELTTALLLTLAPFAPRLGLVGAGLAAGTFAITSTFLITGPSWEESLGGFPALSPAGGFLIKDLALLGIALTVVGRMAARVADGHKRS